MKLRILLPLLTATSALTAHATVIVSLPFNWAGTAPQTLQNLNTTDANLVDETGITGNFMNASNSGSMTTGAALSYAVSGGGTIAAGTTGLSLTAGTNNFTSVAYSSSITGQTIYVGFLYNTGSTGNRFILSTGNTGTVNAPNTSSTPRFDINATAFRVDAAGTGATATASTTLAINTTYLVVGRLNWSGSAYTTMDLWVNPAYNGGVAPTAMATATGGTATSLSSPVFRSLTGTMSVDNFVIGTEWSNVVIPEPGAALLGGLGLLALLRRKRIA